MLIKTARIYKNLWNNGGGCKIASRTFETDPYFSLVFSVTLLITESSESVKSLSWLLIGRNSVEVEVFYSVENSVDKPVTSKFDACSIDLKNPSDNVKGSWFLFIDVAMVEGDLNCMR